MPPNQALPRIRGETVIRVTQDFGDLIKQAAYTEALKVSFTTKKTYNVLNFWLDLKYLFFQEFDYLRDEIKVSDAHNSLIAYIRNINPKALTSDDQNRADGNFFIIGNRLQSPSK